MSQHSCGRQQVLNIALSIFNQYGDALTIHQLSAHLSPSPGSQHVYFCCKPDLIRQLVDFVLTKVKQPPAKLSDLPLTDELRVLLTTYSESFTSFSQTAMFDLIRYYPEELDRIMNHRESHWQRIAVTLEAGAANGRLRQVNSNLFRMMVDGMLLDPLLQEHISLSELVDILLFGMARRALSNFAKIT